MSKTDRVIINSADEVAKSVEILKKEFEKNSSEIKSLLEEKTGPKGVKRGLKRTNRVLSPCYSHLRVTLLALASWLRVAPSILFPARICEYFTRSCEL